MNVQNSFMLRKCRTCVPQHEARIKHFNRNPFTQLEKIILSKRPHEILFFFFGRRINNVLKFKLATDNFLL